MRLRIAVPDEHAEPAVIDAALEAVTRLDESMIRSGQSPTSHALVAAGARWRPENMGDEHFDHGAIIAQRGWGDCDDWAPLHAATLRATGEDPRALARVIPSGPSTFHAVVQRGSGHIELGPEDISARAGMRPIASPKVVGSGSEQSIECCALDPHDGRVYYGQLLPTVGPLSLKPGPQLSVRGAAMPGGRHTIYEGRCDLPMTGSPLVGTRQKLHHKRARVRGAPLPYALSCTAMAPSPHGALASAIQGAVLCGDAAELAMALDRYKLLALQCKLAGMPERELGESLAARIALDVTHEAAAQEAHPQVLLQYLAHELEKDGVGVKADVRDLARAIVSLAGRVPLPRVVGV